MPSLPKMCPRCASTVRLEMPSCGDVGGTCPGGPLGHRYAVALGLALAP
jgi:hypothetical protein